MKKLLFKEEHFEIRAYTLKEEHFISNLA